MSEKNQNHHFCGANIVKGNKILTVKDKVRVNGTLHKEDNGKDEVKVS